MKHTNFDTIYVIKEIKKFSNIKYMYAYECRDQNKQR